MKIGKMKSALLRTLAVLIVVGMDIVLSGNAVFATLPPACISPEVALRMETEDVEVGGEKALSKGDSIVMTAMQYLGARYRRGSMGPTVFDCSGFTSFVFKKENINILRTSYSQFTQGMKVEDVCELKKGDLVFFGSPKNPRRVGHVGIVTDVDPANKVFKFVHACRRGVIVDESTSTYYRGRYLGARRIIEDKL